MRRKTLPAADDTRPRGGEQTAKRACECRNHLGDPKYAYKTRKAALTYMIRKTKYTGVTRVYKCPTSNRWHVTTRTAIKGGKN